MDRYTNTYRPFFRSLRFALFSAFSLIFVLGFAVGAYGQNENAKPESTEKATAIIAKAVQTLGGDKYLQVRTQIGRGKFSVIKEKTVVSFQEFVDVIVFPDKERTEFKVGGVKTVQTNTGNTGWVFDGEQNLIKVQNEK